MKQKTLLIVMLAVTLVAATNSAYGDHAEVAVSIIPSSQSDCEANPCYVPSEVVLNVGDVVTWSNDGTVSTQVMSGAIGDADAGSVFDSGLIPIGNMYSFKFESAGTYHFFSPIQPWMKGTIIVSESQRNDSHDDHGGHGGHDHSAVESTVPVSMDIDVDVEPEGGINVHIMTENWRWAPENVNTEHIPGEGHAHVYVDGEKINRVYGSHYYIKDVESGERVIRVALNTNEHNEITVDGTLVEATRIINVEKRHGDMSERVPVEAAASMAVEIMVDPDLLGGYNMQVIPTDFVFSGEHVNGEHVNGEGYAYVNIDGEHHTRMYGEWLKLPSLEPGMHTITVGLNANDHSPYHQNDQPVSISTTIHVDDADKMMDHHDDTKMDHDKMMDHHDDTKMDHDKMMDHHDDTKMTTMDHGKHDHSAVESTVPVSMDIDVDVEPEGGINVHIMTENWRWAPENVNTEHIPGEGHAHVYVDGEKINRVYGSHYYIKDVESGERVIRVALNTNEHNEITVDGMLVEATRIINVEKRHGDMSERVPVEAAASMAVEIMVDPDLLGGYNMQVIPTDFVFSGEHVNGEHVNGEGYAYVNIDGEHHTRMYGEWLKLPSLEPEMHTITVGLNANDHSPYHQNNEPVSVSTTIHVDDAYKMMDHHDDTKMAMMDDPSATGILSDGTVVTIKVDELVIGQQSRIDVVFDDVKHVNYDLMVTQNGVDVLTDKNYRTVTGSSIHTTNTLESDEPLDITIIVQGYGMSEPYTGPIDEHVVFTNIVPEFGMIVIVVLGVAMTCAAIFGTRISTTLRS